MTTPEVIVEFANAIEELNINSKPQINFLTMLAEDHEQYAPEIVRVIEFDIFPNNKLYGIDVQINIHLDPAWPPAETEVNEVGDDDDNEVEEQVENVGDCLEQQEAKMRQELIAKQQELLRLKQQRIDLELAAAKAELEQQQKKNMSSQPQVSIIPHLEEAVPPPASLTLHTNSETGQPIIRDPRMARDPRLARDPRRLTKDVTSSANTPGFVSDIKDPLINDHQPNISQAWGTVNTINMHQHPAHPHIRGMLPQKIPQFQPFSTMDILHQLNTQPQYVAQDIPVHPFVSPLTGDTFTGTAVTPGDPIPLEPSTKTLDNSSNEKKEFAEKEKQSPGLQRKLSIFRSKHLNNKHSHDHKSQTSPGKKTKPDPKHSSTKSLSKSKSDTDSSKENNDNHSNKKRDSKEKIVSDSKDNREPRSSPRLSMSGSGTDDHKNVKDSRSDSKTDIKSKTESKDSKSRIDTELGRKRKGNENKEDKSGRNLSNDSKGRSRITGKRGRLEDDERSQNGQIRWNSRDRSPIQNSTHLDKEVERGNRKVARENRDLRSRRDSDRYKVSSNTRSGSGSQKDIPKSPDEDGKKNQGFEEMDISRNENKNENAASVVRISLKRDVDDRKRESPESPTMEDESQVKKVKLEIPTIPIEGADIVSKIQDDISELFGKEDQDYRSGPAPHADVEKVVALTLQSPSSKGWDKFKANHPEYYAYDIKLKRQRQEAQDTDQRSNMGDTDFRTPMQRTGNLHLSPEFFHRMPCVEGLRVPQALSMENQADILQHAQEQLIAGKITHEQYQTLLKQFSYLMVIKKLQQELSAREAVEKDPLKNLDPRYMSPRDDFDERKMHSPSKMDIQMSLRHEQTSDMFHHQGQLDAMESETNNGYKDKRGKPAFDHSYRPLGKDSPRSDFQDRIVPTNVASSKQHGAQNLLLLDDMNLGRHGSFDVRGRLDLPPDKHLEEMGGPPSMGPHQDWNFDGRGPHPRGPLHDLDERGLPAPHRRGPLLDLPPDRRGPPDRTRPHEDWRIPPGERRIPFDDRQVQLDDRRGLFDDRGNLFDDRIDPFDDRRDIPEDRRGLPDIPPDHRGPLDERRGPHDLERRGLPDISDWRGPPDRLKPHSEGPLDRRVPLLEGCGERSILIDGKLCELKLNVKIPYVVLEGKIFGIRFDGPDREILIDGHPFLVPLNRAIKVRIGFRPHYIGFGGPCHEVIIDGKWFEVKFGGPPREVKLGNKNITIHLNGPTPDVKFIENWKPQQLASPTRPSVPVGPIGLDLARLPGPPGPHPLMGSQFRPPGLDGIRQQLGLPVPQGMFPPQGPPVPNSMLPQHRPPGPPGPPGLNSLSGVHGISPPSIAMGHAMQGPLPLMGPRALQPSLLGPGPGSMIQPLQQMLPQLGALGSLPVSVPPLSGVGIPGTSIAYSMPALNPTPAQPIADVSSLFNNLVAAGILTTTTSQEPAKTETKKEEPGIPVIKRKKEEKVLEVPDMTDLNMDKLKICHNGVISRLYSGIQCSSCGTRFTLDDTDKYREHLDWHFRQNKRDKEEYKVIRCQKWFSGMQDWTQYEEKGDTEEIARSSIFEQMMAPNPAPTAPAQMPFTLTKVPEGTSFIRCPRATGEYKDDLCDTCHEPFEQYWDDDQEEWHLRDALRINEKTYHPICYEDDHELSDSTPSPSDFPVVKPEFETASSNNACDTTLLETPPSVEAKTEAPDMKITMEVPPLKMGPISLTSSDVQPEANVTTAVSQLTIKQEPNIEESVPFVTEQTSVSAAIDIKVENIKQALIS
ncbi:hypothetical protein ACJMK2_039711 [Sinanodonta woodiana]|uniref:Pre-mRNA cleavage complex 2 protein Pcf11 n=1 Tax=Sinanodonta woodiana TaxID=1069815 RepID=A0ABD3WEU1_SINWO